MSMNSGSSAVRSVFLAALLAVGAVGPALADYSTGLAAYESGDFQTAHREWLPLAEAGDAQAQYRLGILYWKGLGVQQDPAQAAEWLDKAAAQGHAEAQASLALVQKEIGQGPSSSSEVAPAGEAAGTSAPADGRFDPAHCEELQAGMTLPFFESDWETALREAARWQPTAGRPQDFCVHLVAGLLAIHLKANYSEDEAARRFSEIMARVGLRP